MSNFAGKFDSKKQEWTTPQKLFDMLNEEFNFTIDLAADEHNTKCKKFFSKETNGLAQNWGTELGWLNPPYGDSSFKMKDWVIKAYNESQKDDTTIVMLIPARTNTKWWHEYCMKAREIRYILGRPKFGDATHGLPQPLALVVFQKHSGKTEHGTFKYA